MMAGSLLGGVGLFLLGMGMMSEGLRLAAGRMLRDLLARWTGSPLRGVFSGALITSLVQSSSAVTVAVIGFVNAGLISLRQAVSVIYGSNIGTTMTGWLVALIGFNVNLKLFALPLIGLGMGLRLVANGRRAGAWGLAMAGFGVFFIAIDILKTAFAGLGEGMQLSTWVGSGVTGSLIAVLAGLLLTVLTQSSSAAMAIILTSAAGGVVALQDAAIMVIGTNIGTTSTALLAALGATPNARRVAASHLAFNLITAVVALLLLPLLLYGLALLPQALGLSADVPVILALFHTLFNVLGVLLLWPLTRRLVHYLEGRFRSAEEDEARPRYLDRNVVATPVLAMHALGKELGRIGGIALRMAKAAVSTEAAIGPRLEADARALDQLVEATGEFSNLMQRSHLPAELDDVLPNALRVSRYYTETAELAMAIAQAQGELPEISHNELAADIARFKGAVVELLEAAEVDAPGFTAGLCSTQLEALKQDYQQLKSHLLRAGTQGKLPVRTLVAHLDVLSNMRRLAEQAEKAARYLVGLSAIEADEEASEVADAPPPAPTVD